MSDLAVVVPTYDSGRTLAVCLGSLLNQTRPPDAVIVVDDPRTSDDTRGIASAAGAQLIVAQAGRAESRNIGFDACTATVLLSIDSDMVLTPEVLACTEKMIDEQFDALSIREVSIGEGYWARARALDKESVERTGSGRAIRAFTRGVLERVGGFDPGLEAGEDLDFHRRVAAVGACIGHLGAAHIEHDEGRLTLRRAVTKKYRYGRTARAFESKHGYWPLIEGFQRRLAAGTVAGIQADPAAVPGFFMLKLAETAAGALGRMKPLSVT